MNKLVGASEWAGARGERWRAGMTAMEASLAPVDEPLLRAARLDVPLRVADIGCGGGQTTRALLKAAPRGSVAHGFDISPALVAAARDRQPHDPALAFELADAATFVPDPPYDRLVSRFGVMFFDDPPSAFANLSRWLHPGGRFAFAVWGPPRENQWVSVVRDVVSQFIEVPKPQPDAPGPFRYSDASGLLSLLRAGGFTEISVNDWRGSMPVGGGMPAPDAARFALEFMSSFGELLEKAGGDAKQNAQHALTERLASYERGGVVSMDTFVHLVTGERR